MDNHNDLCPNRKKTDDWIVECVNYPHVEIQSLCTEVNSYLCLKYFLNTEE